MSYKKLSKQAMAVCKANVSLKQVEAVCEADVSLQKKTFKVKCSILIKE